MNLTTALGTTVAAPADDDQAVTVQLDENGMFGDGSYTEPPLMDSARDSFSLPD